MAVKTNFSPDGKNEYFKCSAKVGANSDGTPIRKVFYGKSKKEAEKKRDEYLQGIKRGLSVGFDKTTFGAAFSEWFELVHKPKLALSSTQRYETDYRLRIQPSQLTSAKLADIKALDVQRFYNGLLETGTSANSIRNVHKLMSAFFTYAIKSDMVIKNPLLAVELPKTREVKTEKAYVTKNDIVKVISDARHNDDSRIFVFLIFSGLRCGEALSLTNADIDFTAKEIHVNKTVNFLTVNGEYKPVVTTTKTTGSTRNVPIFDELRPILKAHRVAEMEKCFRLGIRFEETSLLFASETGTYIDSRNLRRRWKRLCKRLEIEPTTIHAMRHTFCSMLAENGVNLKTASELMGHADTKMTSKIYTHVQQEEKHRAVATLSSAFSKAL
jgi:integrase